MPRDTNDIGSSGLEQGGANLGNDYSRPITTERNEQNTTTNVGSSSSEGTSEKSERVLDREEDENDEEIVQRIAREQADKLSSANLEDKQRSDNQGPADRIVDGDEGGSIPDPETIKLRHD